MRPTQGNRAALLTSHPDEGASLADADISLLHIENASGKSLPSCPPERGREILLDSLREIVGKPGYRPLSPRGRGHGSGHPPPGERIFNLHLEDIWGKKHYHLLPGLGEIDFRPIFQSLVEVGYRRFITVELYSYVDGPEEAAAKALAYLQRIG